MLISRVKSLTLIGANDNNGSLFWINAQEVVGMTVAQVVGLIIIKDLVQVWQAVLAVHLALNLEIRTSGLILARHRVETLGNLL
jgi:uncharacterized membrane protein AbrB (regulator of aidB expression)